MFSLVKVIRVPSVRAISVEGKFTEFIMFPFSKKSINCSDAITAQFSSASFVLAPICGINRTFFNPIIPGIGKSLIYPPITLFSIASIKSFKFTISARAKFKSLAEGFILRRFLLLIRSLVDGIAGTWSVTKSDWLNKVSKLSILFTLLDSCHAVSTEMAGS